MGPATGKCHMHFVLLYQTAGCLPNFSFASRFSPDSA
jgi:hypothetical protein